MSDEELEQRWPREGSEGPLIGILCGSASDLPIMQLGAAILERFGIPHELRVISAHRNPERVDECAPACRELARAFVQAAEKHAERRLLGS